MRIDSHHHLWNYTAVEYEWIDKQMGVLRRDYTPADLQHAMQAAGIDGTVAVQARQSLQETEWLLELANAHSLIRGVVGWVPLAADNVLADLERLSTAPKLKGVRHVVQSEPDERFLLGADFNRGIGLLEGMDLVYDILIYAKQLPTTIEFVDRFPNQTFVMDHIAKPNIAVAFDEDWSKHLVELSQRSNVSCKFSGVVTEVRAAEWSLETLRPYWEVAWEAFGAERMMFGSDWPVCLLRSDYPRWVSTVEQLASQLSLSEQAAFWGANAQRIYQL